MKKALAILLVTAQLMILISCGSGDSSSESTVTTVTTAAETIEETTSGRANTPDSLPADLDFKGQKVSLLIRHDVELFKSEFYAEEESGDMLNDTIFARNTAVEERLNIGLNVILGEGTWNKWNAFIGLIEGSALSGDGSVDLVPWYAYEQAGLAAKGYYMDLLSDQISYLDLSQPWWNARLVESATINGHLYYAIGDIALSYIAMMAAIAFNHSIKEDYIGDVDLYELVRGGKWTFDQMFSLSRDVYTDSNGNSVRDEGDIFGFDGGRGDQFIHSAKVEISKTGPDGIPVLALNNERMATLVDTIQSFYSTPGYAPSTLKYDANPPMNTTFAQGYVLFSNRYVRDIASLRDMEDDYGVLPLPKLDEAQDGYYTTLGDSYSQVGIVIGTKILDATTATMELLAAESYRNVTETYFESVLKVKFSRDTETAEMLDILLSGIDIDFTEVFGKLIDHPVGKMRQVLQDTCADFTSTYAGIENGVNTKIAQLYETFA
ncbi:MAG: hypothetical protein GX628_03675 [Clostridiales bacterium]|nr:hypothetical protein [Clostridiales bacterium]